jgi:hypothetical protein
MGLAVLGPVAIVHRPVYYCPHATLTRLGTTATCADNRLD